MRDPTLERAQPPVGTFTVRGPARVDRCACCAAIMIGHTRMWLTIAEKDGLFAEVVVCGTEYCKLRSVAIGVANIEDRIAAYRLTTSLEPHGKTSLVRWPSTNFKDLLS